MEELKNAFGGNSLQSVTSQWKVLLNRLN